MTWYKNKGDRHKKSKSFIGISAPDTPLNYRTYKPKKGRKWKQLNQTSQREYYLTDSTLHVVCIMLHIYLNIYPIRFFYFSLNIQQLSWKGELGVNREDLFCDYNDKPFWRYTVYVQLYFKISFLAITLNKTCSLVLLSKFKVLYRPCTKHILLFFLLK